MLQFTDKTIHTFWNIFVFISLFLVSSQVVTNSAAAAGEQKSIFSIFGANADRLTDKLIRFLKRNFYILNIKDALKLIGRIYAASFLKDAIISAVSPKIAKTSVSSQLVQKVENRTFNEDWIADPLHDRMTGVYREKRTVIYDIGTAVVDLVSKMMNFFCRMVVRVLLAIQWTINYVSNSAVALVIFAARSIFCTVSSCMLIVCHFLQIGLRSIRMFYNGLEWTLAWVCSIINDVSLVSIDLIRNSAVSKGEEIFDDLRVADENAPPLRETIMRITNSD